MRRAGICIAFAIGALVASASESRAAGLYFSDRGVRPMGRAGAFVAGADDAHSIWYNPAGLADAKTSFLFDAAWLRFGSDYTRQLLVTDPDGAQQRFDSPTVTGRSPVLPIPTIAGTWTYGDKWTFAAGVIAPYVALASYADKVDGKPSPARYTMGSFDGSILAIPGFWAAYSPEPKLRFGAGVQMLVGKFQTTVTFNASPQDRLLGAPEQQEFDASALLSVGPIFAPSLNAGAIWAPAKIVRFGLSMQAPTIISAPATLQIRMPSSPLFDGARQNGEEAHVRFALPAVLRLGVELRPIDELRLEAAYVHERWSSHEAIDIDPKGMSLDGVTGMPPQVKLPPIAFPRGFQDTHSVRLGSELRYAMFGRPFDLRFGLSYETSAVPPEYLSLASLDFDKIMLSIGGSVHVGKHWRFDIVYAHLFASSVMVTPEQAKIPRINPIKGNAPFEPVNGGTYSASADLIGVGLRYAF